MTTRRLLIASILTLACTKPGPVDGPLAGADGEGRDAAGPSDDPTPPAGPLAPVAVREGPIELAIWAGEGYALLDGEPVPLAAGNAVRREPDWGRGLPPRGASYGISLETIAFAAGPDHAHLILREDDGGGTRYHAHRRVPAPAPVPAPVWVDAELPRDPVAVHYGSFVATADGALLGLRRHTVDAASWKRPDLDPAAREARRQTLTRALARAPRGFTVLSGKPAVVPKLPKRWDGRRAASSSTGEIFALGYALPPQPDADEGPVRLLRWAPGEAGPTIDELPELADASPFDVDLWIQPSPAGEVLIVGGVELPPEQDGDAPGRPYLALGQLGADPVELARIPVELPEVDDPRVSAVAIDDAGQPWLVTGTWNYAAREPCRCLWRLPAEGGAGGLIELEPVELFDDVHARWIHALDEGRWVEIPAGSPPPLYPAARELIRADGAVWVSANVGRTYPTASQMLAIDERTILYSTTPVAGSPTELTSVDRLYDERVDRAILASAASPGDDECLEFFVVLAATDEGEDADAALARLDDLRAAVKLETPHGETEAAMIFFGRYLDADADIPPQLVLVASSWNPAAAAEYIDAVATILGRPTLAADCRPRELVRPVTALR